MNERIDYLSRLYAKHRWSQAQGCQWNLGISFLILSYTHTLLIKISDDRNKYIETWPNQLLLYLYIPSIPQTDFLLALTQTRCLRTQSWVAWQWSWFWYDLDVCYTQLLFFFFEDFFHLLPMRQSGISEWHVFVFLPCMYAWLKWGTGTALQT